MLDDNNQATDDQVTDKPVKEPKAKEPKAEEPKAEEPASSGAAPADDVATPAGTDQQGRQLYDAICASCGNKTQVPFRPIEGRPVYCRDCYMKQKRG